ncbi:hypothetical protein BDZ89DRAFT_1154371 [Hymenopellis radicata]|nr:hypothetical protein BDZ89DRAFT_1154371 [Hymenopellis radicata]
MASDSSTSRADRDRSPSKKRRLPRACDLCKRKKVTLVRCDALEKPGNRCTNCIKSNAQCTHVEVSKNLGLAKDYVETLERRLDKLITLFRKLLPDVDLSQALDDDDEPSFAVEAKGIRNLLRNDEDQSPAALSVAMSRIILEPPERRFFGPSNGLYLIRTVAERKAVYLGLPFPLQPNFSSKGEETWAPRPWHIARAKLCPPYYMFPEDDLMRSLIELYFSESQKCFLPLLHRPSFMKDVADQLYLYDDTFGGITLLVCAIGSRFTNDSRVFAEGISDPGWPFFDQVTLPPPSPQGPASLQEMQLHCLYMIYTMHVGLAENVYIDSGTSFRLAIETGAHMHRSNLPNARDELWKRVFCFDVDLPIDCDDEYWDHPNPKLNFKQPDGLPSSISFFIELLKLIRILLFIKQVIYPARRPLFLTYEQTRLPERQILSKFETLLQEWDHGVPFHLRWDPSRQNDTVFQQSCFLHMTRSYVQIMIHRPYIPAPSTDKMMKPLYPSLGICLNAARSCVRVIEAQTKRGVQGFAYTAAVILLLDAWSIAQNENVLETQSMKDAQTCLNMLKACAKPWMMCAYALSEMLVDLMPPDNLNEGPQHLSDSQSESRGRKRQRNVQTESTQQSTLSGALISDVRHFGSTAFNDAQTEHFTSNPTSSEAPLYPVTHEGYETVQIDVRPHEQQFQDAYTIHPGGSLPFAPHVNFEETYAGSLFNYTQPWPPTYWQDLADDPVRRPPTETIVQMENWYSNTFY